MPCETPESTDVSCDDIPSATVLIGLVVKKLLSQVCMFPCIPY